MPFDPEFIQFNLLLNCPEVIHASFLKHGGYSEGAFKSLNLSDEVGDNPNHVLNNLKKIQTLLNVPSLIQLKQRHLDQVHIIETDTPCKLQGDALVTNHSQIALMIKHADCQACILYDPIEKVIGNVHAGWRGLVQNIYQKTVLTMQTKYGSKPENILACISPSLGPAHAEFIHFKNEFPESFWEYTIKPNHFDLWAIAETELIQSGILSTHIEIARQCTYENENAFFSYRRNNLTGRLGTVICLV